MTDPLDSGALKLAAPGARAPSERLEVALAHAEQSAAAVAARGHEWLRARKGALEGWVALLALVERERDPAFDPDQQLPMRVHPPPGSAPDDPEFQKRKAAHDERLARYRVQTHLGRVGQDALRGTERMVKQGYLSTPADRAELDRALDEAGVPESLRQRLRAAVPEQR